MKYEVDLKHKIVTFKNCSPAYKQQQETLEKIFTKNGYSILNDIEVYGSAWQTDQITSSPPPMQGVTFTTTNTGPFADNIVGATYIDRKP